MKDRRLAAEQQAMRDKKTNNKQSTKDYLDSTNTSSTSFLSSQKKQKPSAADRIGYKKNPR